MDELADLAADAIAGRALEAGGWSPSRQVDVGRFADWYSAEGYPSNDAVMRLLGSIGNLLIVPPDHAGAQFGSGRIVFDPILASTGERPRIADREAQLADALWPIGEWSDSYILLLGASGRLYAESSEFDVLLLGETLVDGLKTIITRRGQIVVAIPADDGTERA